MNGMISGNPFIKGLYISSFFTLTLGKSLDGFIFEICNLYKNLTDLYLCLNLTLMTWS